MTWSVSTYKLYLYLLFIFPITTLFQGTLAAINKLTVMLIFGIALVILFSSVIELKYLILLIFAICSTVCSLFITGTVSFYNTNLIFYFLMWILNIIIFCNSREELIIEIQQMWMFILCIVVIWNCIVTISMFFSSSYSYATGVRAFTSITDDTFRLCTSVFEIMALILPLMQYYRKQAFFLSVIPLITLFMAGSRTYFVIGIIAFVILMYHYFDNKKNFAITLIPVSVVMLAFITSSTIGERFTNSYQDGYYGFLSTFTSGRSDFWIGELKYFFGGNILNQMLGFGFNASYRVNYINIGRLIWSHNDFIECMMCGGYLQLLLYISSIIMLYKNLVRSNNRLIELMLMCIWLFDAFFNMFYTYFCTNIGFLILVLTINKSSKCVPEFLEGPTNGREINNCK